MLWHTLSKLGTHPAISKVFVVLSSTDSRFDTMSSDYAPKPAIALRCGGDTRAQTVLNGLLAIERDLREDDWVLVHDAARACVSRQLVDRMIDTLQYDQVGGIAALAVSDTLKRANEEQCIEATVSRNHLWQAQTPQMFRFGVLLKAMRTANLQHITDEASAVEHMGLRPRLVHGEPTNIKVTYERDVALAEMILKDALH
jgi:2-C-methyl-D-erythritol 4-phosphate cytidylyltransferase